MEQKLAIHKNRNQMSALQPALSSLWKPANLDFLWWSNDLFDTARRNMETVFDGAFANWPARAALPFTNVQPYADISEDQKTVRVRMDVPGLEADDIDISTDGGLLTISADKEERQDGTESRYSFSYSTALPKNVDVDRADVSFANHRLSIDIPKAGAVLEKPVRGKTKHRKHKKARR